MARERSAVAFQVFFLSLALASPSRATQDPLARLAGAFEGKRPVEGRLSGGFAYAAYEPPEDTSASKPVLDRGFYRIAGVASEILDAAAKTPSASNLHAAGVLHLFWNKPEDAVLMLETARGKAPNDAAILSDLSAAYFAGARADSQPYDFIDALEVADESLRPNGASIEGHYNRALALQALHLASEARSAWQHYLDLDAESGWANEARRKLRDLEIPTRVQEWSSQKEVLLTAVEQGGIGTVESIAARFPQEARRLAEGLFFNWAVAVEDNQRAEATRALATIRGIGDALARSNGDQLILDSLRTIEDAIRESDADTISSLVEGHRAYGAGRTLYYVDLKSVEALTRFQESERALREAGTPFRAWALLHVAMCLNLQQKYVEALGVLKNLLALDEDRYPNLLARVHWIEGIALLSRAHPTASLKAYRSALELFQRTGEQENISWASMLVAQNLTFLGEFREAWRYHDLALGGVRKAGDSVAAYAVYTFAAESLSRTESSRIPLYVQDEAFQFARLTEQPVLVAEALYRRSSLHYRLGEAARAQKDLEDAKKFAADIDDPGEHRVFEARIGIAEAEQLSATEPEKAIPALTKSLSLYQDTDFAYLLVELFLQRARAYMAMGDKDKAETDLESALQESERQRERVLEPSLRVSYFDTVQDLFREMVVFQIEERGRPDLGLEYMERGRGRVLLDALGAGPFTLGQGIRQRAEQSSNPMRVEELKEGLPGNVAVVEYLVTEEELFLWVIHEKSLDFVSTQVTRDELQRLTDRYLYLAMGNGNEAELRHVSSELYKDLLGPVSARIPVQSTLVFVPDRFLNAIPFAALVNPDSGRYLIQDRVVGTAPSATHYARAVRIDQELARRTVTSTLVVANPSFDRALFPRLSDLPSAEASAEAITHLYPNSEVLTKEKATKSNFVDRARSHTIVHFGGHTLINPEFPALSRLVFAPADGTDSGVLYAYELYEQRFPETRLVVLASCSSAQQRSSSNEGSTGSLALAFLAAGVPAVLANLWDVEDEVATEFSNSFHRQLREKGNAWEAVRDSQLAFIDSGDGRLASPTSWASFTLIGGGLLRGPEGILENRPSR